jgi:hypothetical protein
VFKRKKQKVQKPTIFIHKECSRKVRGDGFLIASKKFQKSEKNAKSEIPNFFFFSGKSKPRGNPHQKPNKDLYFSAEWSLKVVTGQNKCKKKGKGPRRWSCQKVGRDRP